MSKAEEQFLVAMNEADVEMTKRDKTIKILRQLKQDEKDDKEPAEKKEFKLVGLVPTGEEYDSLPIEDRPILISKMELDEDHNNLPNALVGVAVDHNDSKRATKQGKIYNITDLLTKATKAATKARGLNFQYGGLLTIVPCDYQLVPEDE